jgi:hypothetical protein
MVWIWQHDKRADDENDNKIILNWVRKLMKNKRKRPRKAQNETKTYPTNITSGCPVRLCLIF